jgi:hypothetical protein
MIVNWKDKTKKKDVLIAGYPKDLNLKRMNKTEK